MAAQKHQGRWEVDVGEFMLKGEMLMTFQKGKQSIREHLSNIWLLLFSLIPDFLILVFLEAGSKQ